MKIGPNIRFKMVLFIFSVSNFFRPYGHFLGPLDSACGPSSVCLLIVRYLDSDCTSSRGLSILHKINFHSIFRCEVVLRGHPVQGLQVSHYQQQACLAVAFVDQVHLISWIIWTCQKNQKTIIQKNWNKMKKRSAKNKMITLWNNKSMLLAEN